MARSAIAVSALFFCLALAPAIAMAQVTVAPGNLAPERDARGIPVISDPATAPAGTNASWLGSGPVMPALNRPTAFALRPSASEPPPCSRTVTDNCIQAYDRGSRFYRAIPVCPNPHNPRCRGRN